MNGPTNKVRKIISWIDKNEHLEQGLVIILKSVLNLVKKTVIEEQDTKHCLLRFCGIRQDWTSLKNKRKYSILSTFFPLQNWVTRYWTSRCTLSDNSATVLHGQQHYSQYISLNEELRVVKFGSSLCFSQVASNCRPLHLGITKEKINK